MAQLTFYTKPSCTTCRSAKRYLEDRGVDLAIVDIDATPPTRAFLERHIDAHRFLDFVSVRSPVFRDRPLPRSKPEAIALMLQNANLIKRPVLVTATGVVFGFDRRAYAEAGIR